MAMARAAIDRARGLGDERVLLDVLVSGVAALMAFAHPAERLPLNREAAAIAARLGDRGARLRALHRLIVDTAAAGDLATCHETVAALGEGLAREVARRGRVCRGQPATP
jgi:hypothetical protein